MHGAIAVLHVGRMDEQFERSTIGIDHGMTLSPFDLLSRAVTARTTGLSDCRSRPTRASARARRGLDPSERAGGSSSRTRLRRVVRPTSDRRCAMAGSYRAKSVIDKPVLSTWRSHRAPQPVPAATSPTIAGFGQERCAIAHSAFVRSLPQRSPTRLCSARAAGST